MCTTAPSSLEECFLDSGFLLRYSALALREGSLKVCKLDTRQATMPYHLYAPLYWPTLHRDMSYSKFTIGLKRSAWLCVNVRDILYNPLLYPLWGCQTFP